MDLALDGKSLYWRCWYRQVLLLGIIDALRAKYGDDRVAVTAPTGMASQAMDGETILSFAGIGQGTGTFEEIWEKVSASEDAIKRWKKTRILAIDEISKVHLNMFDLLSRIAKSVLRTQAPFGGIQLVMCGDFFQLPPVDRRDQLTDDMPSMRFNRMPGANASPLIACSCLLV